MLKERRNTLEDFPIVNYDIDVKDSLEKVKNLSFVDLRKFIMNDELREE
jgi:hypothetical protein